jgi:hypothetical protein
MNELFTARESTVSFKAHAPEDEDALLLVWEYRYWACLNHCLPVHL